MAKYIVLNSKFEPMSFADRIAPYKDYYENAYKQQEEIANLELAASSLEKALENERDADLKQQYADYIKQITDLRDSINTFGIDNNIVNEGLKARSVFNSNIVPIMQAQQRRQEAINNWSKDFDKKARYIGNSPLETSITDWMHGATPDIYSIKGSDVAELSKNLTLGVTTDLLDDSNVQKITQGINPNSLYNIIYSMEYNNDSKLTNKEKQYKQHLDSIINAVKADYDFNSLTENQQKQFMDEVYTGILLGNVYNEELKKSGNNGGTKDDLIDFSDLKTVPLNTIPLLSPNIRNAKSNKELIVEIYPELGPYITDDGKLKENPIEIKKQVIIADYLNPLIEKEFKKILNEKGLNESEISYIRRFNIREQATSKVLSDNNIMSASGGYYFSKKYPEDLEKKLAAVKDVSDIEQKLNSIDIEKLKKSYLANFYEIRFSNPYEVARGIIDRAGVNAGNDNLTLKKVKQFKPVQTKKDDKNIDKLEWIFDEGTEVRRKDFNWDKDETNLIGTQPYFFRAMVESDNPGMIMNIDGADYFVPESIWGSVDQTEVYLQDYNIENDQYNNAVQTLKDYAISEGYMNEEGTWILNPENDDYLQLLILQLNTARSAMEAAASRFANNAVNLPYTVKTPEFKIN